MPRNRLLALLAGLFIVDVLTLSYSAFKAPFPSYVPLGPPTAYRNIYIHVPIAEASLLILTVAAGTAAYYLYTGKQRSYKLMHSLIIVGLAYSVATLITGSLWARVSWGVAWNWDPRETSVFFLFIAYLVYLAVKASVKDPDRAPRISAAYALAAYATVPLSFLAPYISESLHPRVYETENFLVGIAGALFGIRTMIVIVTGLLFAYMYYREDIKVGARGARALAIVAVIAGILMLGYYSAPILKARGDNGVYGLVTEAVLQDDTLKFTVMISGGGKEQVVYRGEPPIEPVIVTVEGEEHVTITGNLVIALGERMQDRLVADYVKVVNHYCVIINSMIYLILFAALLILKSSKVA